MSLGRHIVIERQLNDRDYYCRSVIGNAVFPVQVDPAFREDIADEYEAGNQNRDNPGKMACIFLRGNPVGDGNVCAIYASRPIVCRDFRCYHILLLNREGAVCGRVSGRNALRTDDPVLGTIWKEQVAAIPCGDPALWIKKMAGILANNGFSVDPVE